MLKLSKSQKYTGVIVFVLATAAAIWGLSSATVDTETLVESISWDKETIVDENGEVLVDQVDAPGSMQVSADSEFGAAGPFGSVSLSEDSRWIAFSTSGAAHDGGWLYDIETSEVLPVAFQYGGGIEVLEWSPDSHFVAFSVSLPSGSEHILVVDREDVDGYVSDIGQQIEVAAEADMNPPFAYEFIGWEAPHTLCFSFTDESVKCIDADDMEL